MCSSESPPHSAAAAEGRGACAWSGSRRSKFSGTRRRRRPGRYDCRMRVFRDEPLLEIITYLQRGLAGGAPIELAVPDPDRGRTRHAGELIDGHVHRPFRVWVDLAERLGLRLQTPQPGPPPLIDLRFEPLARAPAPRDTSRRSTVRPRRSRGSTSGKIRASCLIWPTRST